MRNHVASTQWTRSWCATGVVHGPSKTDPAPAMYALSPSLTRRYAKVPVSRTSVPVRQIFGPPMDSTTEPGQPACHGKNFLKNQRRIDLFHCERTYSNEDWLEMAPVSHI